MRRDVYQRYMPYKGEKRNLRRKFMRFVREMNKSIAKDEAWKGRFECAPVDIQYVPFADNSGVEMVVTLAFYDKATKNYAFSRECATWYCNFGRLWLAMNQFITEFINTAAWRDEVKDYTKERINWNQIAAMRNVYTSENHWMVLH